MFKAPTVVQADGTAIWARGFGGNRVQQADVVLLRASNTQPVLVMRFEAPSQDLLNQYQQEVENVLEDAKKALV